MRIAVIDDWQNCAPGVIDWAPLKARAEIQFFTENFGEDEAAKRLGEFDIILSIRERTPFPPALIQRLPRLKMLSLTGLKAPHVDFAACTQRGIVCTQAAGGGSNRAAEMALALMLAVARQVPKGDAALRDGKWQEGVPAGLTLQGKTLGIIGLGKIGAVMTAYGRALSMRVLAWSQNLTPAKAAEAGAEYAEKDALIAQSDVVSLHLVLSARTRGILGASDIARMKKGEILINTARGPLVDEKALLTALHEGRILAGLDVFDIEPLPADHPLRRAPNTVLTPHIGFTTTEGMAGYLQGAMENILAFLDGKPANVANPEVLTRA